MVGRNDITQRQDPALLECDTKYGLTSRCGLRNLSERSEQ